MKTAFTFSILLLTFSLTVFCQKVEIKGKVTDIKGKPLLFASVTITGSLDGTTTNERGEFSFYTSKRGQQIIAGSYIGYESSVKEIFIEETDIEIEFILASKTTQLQEVIITAGSFEASDIKRAVVMRARDIGTTAGATGDITKAIETLPGVQIVGESSGLFVRGGSGSESKVFIDEMIVQNPFYSSVPDVKQRGRFDPFMFSGTVFNTGGYSARYGQALSSVLALTSNSLADSTNTGGGLYAYGINLFHVHRWEKSSVYIKSEYNNFYPYNSIFKQLTEWKKSPENSGLTFNFRHKFSENDILKFYASYSQTALSLKYNNPDSLCQKRLFKLRNDNFYLNSTFKKFFNDEKWSLFIGTSYSIDINNAFMDSLNMSENEELVQGRIIVSNNTLPGMTLFAGSEIQVKNTTGKQGSLNGNINDVITAGYLEANWTITPRLGTRIGVRFENSSLLKDKKLSPRLSLAYKTSESGQISFAFGKFYQTPENEFLYYKPELNFEQSTHYIASYQLIKNKRVFRIELFDKEYKNLIRVISDRDKNFDNLGYGYARGIDVFWRDEMTIPGADYWISYSFLDTKRKYLDYPILSTPGFASKHNISFVYKHWIQRINLMAGITYSYSSGRPYFNPQRPDSEFHEDITHPYNNFSLNFSKMIKIFGRSSVIYASLDNLFGAKHIFGYYYLPNSTERIPIRASSIRSFFIGCFISTY
jgi:outer membrane cobalamin receptor